MLWTLLGIPLLICVTTTRCDAHVKCSLSGGESACFYAYGNAGVTYTLLEDKTTGTKVEATFMSLAEGNKTLQEPAVDKVRFVNKRIEMNVSMKKISIQDISTGHVTNYAWDAIGYGNNGVTSAPDGITFASQHHGLEINVPGSLTLRFRRSINQFDFVVKNIELKSLGGFSGEVCTARFNTAIKAGLEHRDNSHLAGELLVLDTFLVPAKLKFGCYTPFKQEEKDITYLLLQRHRLPAHA
ncbi:unnamed protein product [Owenia fusiformis]|uniref:Uncharacterized protein n=1 Tax=Owenia fusiformis TaxID=6347 RepID=A0A8J1UD72_OWEFU|nr:unnamed protein product [Owenia fusiformis]